MTRTFGTINLTKDGKWQITAEPHVMLRLKRVFDRIDKGEHGTANLSNTPETCFELLWFVRRYPLNVSARDYMVRQAARFQKATADLEEVLRPGYAPKTYPSMALPPRDYQRVVADILMKRHDLLLCDELGVGKTVSALCVMSSPLALPALVVVPTHLQVQWEAEAKRFLPHLNVHVIRSGKPYDLERTPTGRKRPKPDIIIVSYGRLIHGWADHLAGKVRYVVVDEAQELRSGTSDRYSAVKHILSLAKLRLLLSATPIHNYGGEIWNVLNAQRPACLGSREEFLREWCKPLGQDKHAICDVDAFHTYLRENGLMLRRTRREVGREIPPKQAIHHHVDCDTSLAQEIISPAIALAKTILAKNRPGFEKMEAGRELSWRLRQATGIAKAPYVADFVRMLVENGEPVVLSGYHREVYAIWLERLKNLNPVMYTGSEGTAAKQAAKEAFLAGKTDIFIISNRSGAGLDGLQKRCKTGVCGELDWAAAIHEQLEGRLARDGQEHPVTWYYPTTAWGSDPVLMDILGLKQGQLDGIRGGGDTAILAGSLDPDHIRKLATSFLRQAGHAVPVDGPPILHVDAEAS